MGTKKSVFSLTKLILGAESVIQPPKKVKKVDVQVGPPKIVLRVLWWCGSQIVVHPTPREGRVQIVVHPPFQAI